MTSNESPLYSMTGFGVAEAECDGTRYTVRVRSVNHRFCDISVRLPHFLMSLEHQIRSMITEQISRGKVDVHVQSIRTNDVQQDVELVFSQNVFEAYLRYYSQVLRDESFQREELLQILTQEGVFSTQPATGQDDQEEKNTVCALVSSALDSLVEMRKKEGKSIKEQLLVHHGNVALLRRQLSERAQTVTEEVKTRFSEKIEKLLGEVALDEGRMMQEIALMIDKADITEELDRFADHLALFKEFVQGGAPGKKLDFLVQEMLREVNTTGAKSADSSIRHLVVDAKNEIECIREKVHNIE